MQLIIENKIHIDLTNFCTYLIKQMQEHMLILLNPLKIDRFNNYLETLPLTKFPYNKRKILSMRDILIGSTYNLKVTQHWNEYKIEIDPTSLVYGTFLKYIDLVKLVNYGNLQLAPYPIYDELMNYFAEHLEEFYEEYLKEE